MGTPGAADCMKTDLSFNLQPNLKLSYFAIY